MATNEHIAAEILERYRRKISIPTELLRVQRHLGVCEACRKKAAQILVPERALAAVRRDFAFENFGDEPEHLAFEQLEFFLDDKMDAVDREIAESHLAICDECATDLLDLRRYREIAAAAPVAEKQTLLETSPEPFWRRIFAFNSFGSVAPVAAVLLIAVLFGAWFLLGGNRNGEIARVDNQNAPAPNAANANPATNSFGLNAAPVNAPEVTPSAEILPKPETLYALNDGGITVDNKGGVKGLDNLSTTTQNAVRQSLQTGRVSVSDAGNALGGGGGVLMSGGSADNGVPFGLQTPIGKIVRENQPTLRWKPLKDATAYSVAIVDEQFRVVAESGKINSTNWKPAKPLPRGANYSWQVTAALPDGTESISPSSPAPQAKFRVIEQNLADEIGRLEKSADGSHLALGILYAKAGLKREARAEFERLVKENPKSDIARRLLQSVK